MSYGGMYHQSFAIDSRSVIEIGRRRLENCKRSKVTTSGRGLICQPSKATVGPETEAILCSRSFMLDFNRTWHGDSRDLNVEDRIISLPQNSRVVDWPRCHVFDKNRTVLWICGNNLSPKKVQRIPKLAPGNLPFDPISMLGISWNLECSGETARIRLEDMVKPGFHDSIPSVGSMATFIALSFGATRVVPDGPEAWKRQSQRQTRGIADAHNNQDSKPLCEKFPVPGVPFVISYFIFFCCRDPGSFLAHQVGKVDGRFNLLSPKV